MASLRPMVDGARSMLSSHARISAIVTVNRVRVRDHFAFFESVRPWSDRGRTSSLCCTESTICFRKTRR